VPGDQKSPSPSVLPPGEAGDQVFMKTSSCQLSGASYGAPGSGRLMRGNRSAWPASSTELSGRTPPERRTSRRREQQRHRPPEACQGGDQQHLEAARREPIDVLSLEHQYRECGRGQPPRPEEQPQPPGPACLPQQTPADDARRDQPEEGPRHVPRTRPPAAPATKTRFAATARP
jgi:hypothetical protein